MRDERPRWQDVSSFCLFVGYGRSGHSAIGSIIDAHPNAVVSHELNALQRFAAGVSRDELFRDIFMTAQRQAMAGRRSSRVDGGTFLHQIDGQLKSSARDVRVLGDKKGAGTTAALAQRGLDTLHAFARYVAVPLKVLHVVRNPFDIVAAGLVRGRTSFADLVPVVADARRRTRDEDWLDVYYEDVLSDPRQEIARILRFLGLPVVDTHLAACEAYLFPEPHRRRFETAWPDELRTTVAQLIQRFEFLGRYSWES